MIALYPHPDVAADLAVPGGLPPDELHITVAYTGHADDVDPARLYAAAETVARRQPFTATLSGHARFTGGPTDVHVALVDSPEVEKLRADVLDALAEQGIDVPADHGYCAHLSIQYLDAADVAPTDRIEARPLHFDHVSVVHGGDRVDVPLRDEMAQAAREAYAMGWAVSGGPMTDRVRAGATAAVDLALRHFDRPGVLEATLHLGHLEGVWAAIFDRRLKMHADNEARIKAAWAKLGLDRYAHQLVTAFRRRREFTEAESDQSWITNMAQQLADDGMDPADAQQLKATILDSLRRAAAEGQAGSVALSADQLGMLGTDFDIAFNTAYQAMLNDEELLNSDDEEAGSWLSDMLGDQAREVGQKLMSLLNDGANAQQMIDAVKGILTGADSRAVALGTDLLTSRAMSKGALDLYQSEGLAQVDFITAGDQRVCTDGPNCAGAEENSPYLLADAPVPGLHPSCVPGSSRVTIPGPVGVPVHEPVRDASDSVPAQVGVPGNGGLATTAAETEAEFDYGRRNLRAVTVRDYVGEFVSIRTALGYELTGTPNHPVATRNGWVPLAELALGDHVLSSTRLEWAQDPVDPDVHDVPPRIEDVAKSLPVRFGPMPTAPEDFHGDGAGSKIHVVRADRFLGDDRAIGASEEIAEQPFGRRDVLAAGAPLSAGRRSDEILDTPLAAQIGSVGRFGEALPLGVVGLTHAHEHRCAPAACFDTSPFRAITNDIPADTHGFCERLLALSGDVALDEVIHVQRDVVSTQVFNLESVGGWYFVNGIATHNCRCVLAPTVPLPPQSIGRFLTGDLLAGGGEELAAGEDLATAAEVTTAVEPATSEIVPEVDAEIVAAAATANAIADLQVLTTDELIASGQRSAKEAAAWARKVRASLDQWVARGAVTDPEAKSIRSAVLVRDTRRLNRIADEIASRAELTATARIGDIVKMDSALHAGAGIADGAWVKVTRAGYARGNDALQVVKADVSAIPVSEILSGDSSRSWVNGRPGTGWDHPLLVRGVTIRDGDNYYTIAEGWAFKVDGVGYLVEKPLGGGEEAARRIAQNFERFHASLPPGVARLQRTYTAAAGSNPSDDYWARKHGITGFTSQAMAGGGHITMWHTVSVPVDYSNTLWHEAGHNISQAMEDEGLDARGLAWRLAAGGEDARAPLYDFTPTPRMGFGSHNPTLADDPAAKFPPGVTKYGRSAASEDYAESISLYREGKLGTGRLTVGGPLRDITFRDMFPARARVLDQIFGILDREAASAVRAARDFSAPAMASPTAMTRGLVIRSALTDATDVAAVSGAFEAEAERITGREIPARFEGSVETAREHAEGLLRALERFPDADLKSVSTKALADSRFAEADGAHIRFHASWTSDDARQRYLDVLARSEREKFHVPGSASPAGTAIHELAHVVAEQTLGGGSNAAVVQYLKDRAAQLGHGMTPDDVAKFLVSRAAAADVRELVAEAMTDVMLNGEAASADSRRIYDIVVADYRSGARAVVDTPRVLPMAASLENAQQVRAELEKARTLQAVNDAFAAEAKRITGRDVEVEFYGNIQTAREHSEGVLRGLERFPRVPLRSVTTVLTENVGSGYAKAQGAWDLWFSQSWAGNRPRYLDSLAHDVAEGWHPTGTGTPVGVALHEFGHAVAYSGDWSGLRADVQALVDERAADAGVAVDEFVRDAVSGYGASHVDELVADAFADVMVNGEAASALSRDIFDRITARYEERGAAVGAVSGLSAPALRQHDLDKMAVADLKALASERGVSVAAGAKKADLIDALLGRHPRPAVPEAQTVRPVLAKAKGLAKVAEAVEGEARRVTDRPWTGAFRTKTDWSVDTFREHVEGIMRGLERYPDADFEMFKPETHSFRGGDSSFMRTHFTGVIEANDGYASVRGRNAYLSALSRGYDGHYLVTGGPIGTAIHEFGHVLDVATLQEAIHPQVQDLVARMASDAGMSADRFVALQVSSYAATRTAELVAEAFADVMVNGEAASQLSQEIAKILDSEYLKPAAGLRGGQRRLVRLGPKAATTTASEDLSKLTLTQLKALAKERGVDIPAGAKKADLVTLLGGKAEAAASSSAVLSGERVKSALLVRDSGSLYRLVDAGDVAGVDGLKVQDAVADYESNGHEFVNDALRFANGDLSKVPAEAPPGFKGIPGHYSIDRVHAMVRGLDALMAVSRTEEPIEVYRGVLADRRMFGLGLDTPGGLLGHEWIEHGYSSTSVREETARTFAANGAGVKLNLVVAKDVGAVGLENRMAESEILLQRDLRYQVLTDRMVNDVRTLDVEVSLSKAAESAPADLSKLPVAKLRAMAKERGIDGAAAMKKPELLDALAKPKVDPSAEKLTVLPPGLRGQNGDGRAVLASGAQGPWGKYGASGIVLRHVDPATGEERFLMVKRGEGVDQPGKWAFPGGAKDELETVYQGAARELVEELGVQPSALSDARVQGVHMAEVPAAKITTPDGRTVPWSFVSIAAEVPAQIEPVLTAANRWETAEAKWLTRSEIDALDKQGQLLEPLAGGQFQRNVLSLFPRRDGLPKVEPTAADLAKARQAEIDAARPIAEDLVQVEYALANGMAPADAVEFFRDSVRGNPAVAKMIAALEKDGATPAKALTAVRGVAKKDLGLTPIDKVGGKVAYKPGEHAPLTWDEDMSAAARAHAEGNAAVPETKIEVVRPGYALTRADGERIVVEKASVAPVPKPAKKAPATKKAAAPAKATRAAAERAADAGMEQERALRARFEKIEERRSVADALSEVHELVNNESSAAAIRSRIEARQVRIGNAADLSSLLRHVDDPEALKAAVDEMAREHGLERVGDAGQVTRFNRELHKPIGPGLREGTPVEVVRPGYVATMPDGSRVMVGQPLVEETDEIPPPGKREPTLAELMAPRAAEVNTKALAAAEPAKTAPAAAKKVTKAAPRKAAVPGGIARVPDRELGDSNVTELRQMAKDLAITIPAGLSSQVDLVDFLEHQVEYAGQVPAAQLAMASDLAKYAASMQDLAGSNATERAFVHRIRSEMRAMGFESTVEDGATTEYAWRPHGATEEIKLSPGEVATKLAAPLKLADAEVGGYLVSAASVRAAELPIAQELAGFALDLERQVRAGAAPTEIIASIQARMKTLGLKPIGKVGDTVPLDRAQHAMLGGGAARDVTKVDVLKPGYTWPAADNAILTKATVDQAAEVKPAAAATAKAAADQARPEAVLAMKGDKVPQAKIKSMHKLDDSVSGMRVRVLDIAPGENDYEDYYPQWRGWSQVDVGIDGGAAAAAENSSYATILLSPDGRQVYYSALALDATVQGQGFVTRLMTEMFDRYKAAGVETLGIKANADVGGYAWARAGFRFLDDNARQEFAAYARAYARGDEVKWYEPGGSVFGTPRRAQLPPDIVAAILRVADNPAAEPIDYAMIGQVGGTKLWPGKEFMLGSEWQGAMDIAPPLIEKADDAVAAAALSTGSVSPTDQQVAAAERRAQLEASVDRPRINEPIRLAGGQGADVQLVDVGDGPFVEKRYGSRYAMSASEIRYAIDAEVLGPQILDAMGGRGAAVVRAGKDSVAVEFLDGEHLDWFTGTTADRTEIERLAATDGGRIVGLLSYLTSQMGLNDGNWLRMTDGRIGVFDFPGLFANGDTALLNTLVADTPTNVFTGYLNETVDGVIRLAERIDWNPADLAIISDRLEALQPLFVELKRSNWYRAMMKRLAEVKKRADPAAARRLS
jgi:8-oxo-dGTP pyrophosphatase MutT (NUDIX family)/2'-5' RNA ligase